MKKTLLTLIALMLSLFIVGCQAETTTQTQKQTTTKNNETTTQADGSTTKQGATTADPDLLKDLAGKAQGVKVYLTTCGQSDVNVVVNIIENQVDPEGETIVIYTDQEPTDGTIKVLQDESLEATDIELSSDPEKLPFVLLVLGTSSKGLGAAGTDVQKETARAEAFANLAKEGKIVLVCLHVGGAARRGELSDPVITAAFAGANAVLVKADGNTDGFFTNLAEQNNTQYFLNLEKTPNFIAPLKVLFGME